MDEQRIRMMRESQEYLATDAARSLEGAEERLREIKRRGPDRYERLATNTAERAWFDKPDQQMLEMATGMSLSPWNRLRRRWLDWTQGRHLASMRSTPDPLAVPSKNGHIRPVVSDPSLRPKKSK